MTINFIFMVMVNCKECGRGISKKAKACPNCGYQRKPMTISTWAVLGLVFLTLYTYRAVTSLQYDQNAHTAPSGPEITSEKVRAKEPVKPPPDPAKEAISKRQAGIMVAGAALKETLREPDSVEWLKILTNEEGLLVCFEYKARNGFGGMGFEKTAMFYGQPVEWNKFCANRELHDMTYAKRVIR